MQHETQVVIVGAGPAGLAISACLNLKNIPNIILEKEDCYASLWKKRSYNRLKLHLAKQFCELPHMSFPPDAPTFVSKHGFIEYLDNYVSRFNVSPLYFHAVRSTWFDDHCGKWVVLAESTRSSTMEKYVASFLVVATGENSEGYIPKVPGLDTFPGLLIHSSHYENGNGFEYKNVLVVGCGNSGMEIAYDLSSWGAKTSIVARSPVHVLTERMVQLGMVLMKFVPCEMVDNVVMNLSKWKYGDLSKYGLRRPNKGPFFLKKETGRSPVIDVGTLDKILANEIKVLPSISSVNENQVQFAYGDVKSFDAIVFATGYKSTVTEWLKDYGGLFGEEGMPKNRVPHHWKGENGLYCVGFSRAGLFGISNDAKIIAEDIEIILSKSMTNSVY